MATFQQEFRRVQALHLRAKGAEEQYWFSFLQGMQRRRRKQTTIQKAPENKTDKAINAARGEWDGYNWEKPALHLGPVKRGGTSNAGAGRPPARPGAERRRIYLTLTPEEWEEFERRGGGEWIAGELGRK